MRCRRLIVATVMLLACGAGVVQAAPPQYYLALGDSLAIGTQPNASGDLIPTNQGYADDLYALYRLRRPNLRLAKMGCSGETTSTMLNGGTCDHYESGNQLDDAVQFIATHRVALITVSIGGDNVLRCFDLATFGVDEPCVAEGLAVMGPELLQILTTLRTAAGPGVPIVGMNYYDPFLAASTLGPEGAILAANSLIVTMAMNDILGGVYFGLHMPVADVAQAFRITDTTIVPGYDLPLNVLLEFAWTWVGAPPPVGPDIHPNRTGYAVIAGAFVKAISSS